MNADGDDGLVGGNDVGFIDLLTRVSFFLQLLHVPN
jgi:hypothetical protein